jgi:hypothetical protein
MAHNNGDIASVIIAVSMVYLFDFGYIIIKKPAYAPLRLSLKPQFNMGGVAIKILTSTVPVSRNSRTNRE